MNTHHWIHHFEKNTRVNLAIQFPKTPCNLPDEVRIPLAKSLAVFQLGESGSGSRIRRYAREVAPLANFEGYQEAIDRFIKEELSHSKMLARTVEHLGGKLIQKQWTNSIFRHLRFLVNLEFAIQVLLTAELIAEVYYGTLYLHCPDPVVRQLGQKILRDEMQHLAFQREFLSERVATFSKINRWLWRLQFRAVHALTAAVVSWDHRDAIRALGIDPNRFRESCLQGWKRFQGRLERSIEALDQRNAPAGSTQTTALNHLASHLPPAKPVA
jgi:hypothetical protein